MVTDTRTYQFEGELLKETDKAIFIEIHSVEDELLDIPYKREWFPKSQIVDTIFPTEEDQDHIFVGKHWIMEGKGLLKP